MLNSTALGVSHQSFHLALVVSFAGTTEAIFEQVMRL